jgi:hypothetical protein
MGSYPAGRSAAQPGAYWNQSWKHICEVQEVRKSEMKDDAQTHTEGEDAPFTPEDLDISSPSEEPTTIHYQIVDFFRRLIAREERKAV